MCAGDATRAAPAAVFLIAWCLPCAGGGSNAEGAGKADREKAEEIFSQGAAKFDEEDYEGALSKFRRSFELHPHWKTRYHMGMCHFHLEQYVDAIVELSRFVEEAPSDVSSKQIDTAIKSIVESRSCVLTIKLSESAEGLHIEVDGEAPGTSPDGRELFLEPGEHELRMSSGSEVVLDERIDGDAGEVQEFRIYIGKEGGEKTDGKAAGETEEAGNGGGAAGSRSKKGGGAKMGGLEIAGWTALGAAVAMMAAGAVTGGLAIKERNEMEDMEKKYARLQGSASDEVLREIEGSAWDHYDRSLALSRSSTALMAAGGAAAAGAVTCLVLDAVRERRNGSASGIHMSASPAGIFVMGSF
jgi:tetratricopeptide (TPR) repeat protein